MPLTLECVCSDTSTVCAITHLTLSIRVDETFTGSPHIGATHYFTIWANKNDPAAPAIVLDTTPGEYTVDLPIADWVPRWDTISMELDTTASLLQVPDPPWSAYDLWKAVYHIQQVYECRNVSTNETSTYTVDAYSQNPDAPTACSASGTDPSDPDLYCLCTAGVGVRSIFYKSKPLNFCGSGCSTSDGKFIPNPVANPITDIDLSSGQLCLCATGGTGSYTYSIMAGTLPSGLHLNSATGCIEGTADGHSPGSSQVTFRVTDSGGGGFAGRGDVTIGGTCVKSGSNVLRVSGGAFDPSMVGQHITINHVVYTITYVSDANNMTVA